MFVRAQGYRNRGRSNLISILWDITWYLWSQTKILEPLKERFQTIKGAGIQGLRGLASLLDDFKKGWLLHRANCSAPSTPSTSSKTGDFLLDLV